MAALALRTRYWRPGTDYAREILRATRRFLRDKDFLVVSEKAISTAMGRLVDEAGVRPGSLARLLASFWVRKAWGHALGPLCHLSPRTIMNLRAYPLPEGAAHKQVALRHSGLLSALMWGSEGGIDASNLPYSLVALPLRPREAVEVAEGLAELIRTRLGKEVVVLIADSDRTYSAGGLHLSPRPTAVRGIIGGLGVLAYVIGNSLGLRGRPTPVASSRTDVGPELALRVASLAEKAMGHGAGRDVWEMAERFGVGLTEVSWEMLESVIHKPIAIVRFRRLR